MSKIKFQGNASGTGVLTITSPNTDTDRTITLPDATGTLLNSDGSGANLSGVATLDGNSNLGVGATSTTNFSNYKTIATNDTTGGMFEIMVGGARTFNIQSTASLTNMQTRTNIPIAFEINTAEKMRLTSDGLTFNGDTAADNALDDYEEGTCSIQYSDGSTTVGDSNLSKYTKVGRLVTVTGYLNVTNIDSLSNGLPIRLTGFPFTNTTDTTFPYFSRFWDMPTGTINTVGYLPLGQTHCTFYAMKDNASYQQITCGDVGNNNDLYFGVSYHAS